MCEQVRDTEVFVAHSVRSAVCSLEKATAPVFCMSVSLKYARQVVEKLAFRSLPSPTRLSPFRMDSRDGSRAASGFAEFL